MPVWRFTNERRTPSDIHYGVKDETLVFDKKFQKEFYTEFHEHIKNAFMEIKNIFISITDLGKDIKNENNDHKFYHDSIDKTKIVVFAAAWKKLHSKNDDSDKITQEIKELEFAIRKVSRKTFIKLLRDVKNQKYKTIKKHLFFREKRLKDVIEHDENEEISFIESLKKKIENLQRDFYKYCIHVDKVYEALVDGFPNTRVERDLAKLKKNNFDISLKNVNQSFYEAKMKLTKDLEKIGIHIKQAVSQLNASEKLEKREPAFVR